MAFKLAELFTSLTLRDAEFKSKLASAHSSLQGMEASLQSLGAVGRNIFLGLAGAATFSVVAWGKQEEASMRLQAALQATGASALIAASQIEEYSAQIQKLTTYGDEVVTSIATQIANFGVYGNQIKEATSLAIGLAEVLGIDITSASKYAAMAIQGETTILRRYIPELRSATSAQESFEIVVRKGQQGLQQAAARSHTLYGETTRLKNSFGDMAEVIGQALAPNIEDLTKALMGFTLWVQNLDGTTIHTVITVGKWVAALGLALYAIPKVIALIRSMIGAYQALAASQAIVQALAGPKGWLLLAAGVVAATSTILAINELMSDFMEMGETAEDSGEQISKLADEMQNLELQTKKASAAQRTLRDDIWHADESADNMLRTFREQVDLYSHASSELDKLAEEERLIREYRTAAELETRRRQSDPHSPMVYTAHGQQKAEAILTRRLREIEERRRKILQEQADEQKQLAEGAEREAKAKERILQLEEAKLQRAAEQRRSFVETMLSMRRAETGISAQFEGLADIVRRVQLAALKPTKKEMTEKEMVEYIKKQYQESLEHTKQLDRIATSLEEEGLVIPTG